MDEGDSPKLFSPKNRLTAYSLASELLPHEENSMDLNENVGVKNEKDLHVMLPTEFKLIKSL